jgi:hypothetical protein
MHVLNADSIGSIACGKLQGAVINTFACNVNYRIYTFRL